MKQVIIFNNCEQNFALELERIERIIEYSKPKKLPETAEYILGVIQYNEKVLPIIDLNRRLYSVPGETGNHSKIIVILWKGAHLGLVVDEILGIKTVEDSAYEEAAMGEESISSEYIKGFLKIGEDIIIVMDTDKLFSFVQSRELLELEEDEDDEEYEEEDSEDEELEEDEDEEE
ncbi:MULTISPECIES: chemotaxis protein CheW [Proteiniclasticum]|uniref:Purine-binding chemotaxis protein CheW n=1 Tax=Proteiniclasticum ruminis TaxID=398199 RepID=A0A1I5CC33_9CLOT|nr:MULTISPECIES: chemotaxis protein CheW [Proteiniclasticum]SFN84590.1 purine-binding chemotaxis protein CheW [Proteiniclasticum ruminis]